MKTPKVGFNLTKRVINHILGGYVITLKNEYVMACKNQSENQYIKSPSSPSGQIDGHT